MRGTLADLHPVVAAVLYSFEQAREDLDRWVAPLKDEQLWARPFGLAAAGFHIRHIGGSVERLTAYLFERQLSPGQLADLQAEANPGAPATELIAELKAKLAAAEKEIRTIYPATLTDPRGIGRKRLPTTVGGLLVHIAEHTQRHVGQAIVTAKVVAAPT